MNQPPNPTQAFRVFPLRALCVSVVILSVGLVAARHHYLAHVAFQQQLATWNQDQAREQRLEQLVEMKFDEVPTLDEWLAEWTRQTGIPASISSQSGRHDGRVKIDLTTHSLAASDALQSLCHIHHWGWQLQADGNVVLHLDGIQTEPKEFRHYAVPGNLADNPDFPATLQQLVQFSPPDAFVTPGCLQLLTTRSEHHSLALRLQQLSSAVQLATQAGESSAAMEPDAWQPTLIDDDPAALQRALALLEQQVNFVEQRITIEGFARELSKSISYPVVIEPQFRHKLIQGDRELNIQHLPQALPLQQALARAEHDWPLRAIPVASGRALMLLQLRQPANTLCYAYPVSDLVTIAPGRYDYRQLLALINNSIFQRNWSFSSPCGPVLVAHGDIEDHEQLQILLKTIRTARGGLSGSLVRGNRTPEAVLRIRNSLARPAELIYLEVPIGDVLADLRKRFQLNIELDRHVASAGFATDTSIWCHLPAQPLGDNLQRMLSPYRLTFQVHGDVVHVMAQLDVFRTDERRNYQFDVYNLRSLFRPGSSNLQTFEDLLFEFDPSFEWQRSGGAGQVAHFGELLILKQEPHRLDNVRRVMSAVQNQFFLSTEQVRKQAQFDNSAPFLKDPALANAEARGALEPELWKKLAAPVTVSFEQVKTSAALLALAREHQLPVVYPGSQYVDLARDAEISLQSDGDSLVSVLQQLLPEKSTKRWIVSGDGTLQTWEPDFLPASINRQRWLFDVSDLLRPHGKLLPGQLYRTLNQEIFVPPQTYNDAKLTLHLGRFLSVQAVIQECAAIQDTLDRLRRGKLEPLAEKKGDESITPLEWQRWKHGPPPETLDKGKQQPPAEEFPL